MDRRWKAGRLASALCALAPWVAGARAQGPAASASAPRDAVLPLLAEPEVRWSFGPLAFESAPELADGRVLAGGRDATGRRALVVLDEHSGRMLSSSRSRSRWPSPPRASAWPCARRRSAWTSSACAGRAC
jgi:hypothetical protein